MADNVTPLTDDLDADRAEEVSDPSKADCYSDGERATMLRYQGFKQRLLGPLLRWLTAARVTPDAITLVSLVFGLAFCPIYLLGDSMLTLSLAWALLILHLIIDGVDGPLARHQNVASRGGSFADTMADQVVVAATTLTFMYAELQNLPGLGLFAGGTYLFLYSAVVAFAMVRNAMRIPYRFILRPRNYVYLFLWLEAFVVGGPIMQTITESFVWLFNAMFLVSAITGYAAIRRSL